jgi:glutamate racemase
VDDAPIGIFDSGFGGLTVARAVMDLLPDEAVIYLGDTARQPYGPKPISDVREYALDCLDHLVTQGVKALVIACNSASAAVLRDARERYDVPVVEVIVPAARRAVNTTRNGRIGVICTRSTATSRAYDDALSVAPNVEVFTSVCPRFVEFVEAGVTSGPEVLAAAEELAEEVAQTLRRKRLARRGGRGTYRFVCTGDPESFRELGTRFLQMPLGEITRVELGVSSVVAGAGARA